MGIRIGYNRWTTLKSVVKVKDEVAEKWRAKAVTTLDRVIICTPRRPKLGVFLQSYPRFLVVRDAPRSNVIGIESDGESRVLSIGKSWRKRISQTGVDLRHRFRYKKWHAWAISLKRLRAAFVSSMLHWSHIHYLEIKLEDDTHNQTNLTVWRLDAKVATQHKPDRTERNSGSSIFFAVYREIIY